MTPETAIVTAADVVEYVKQRRPEWPAQLVIENLRKAALTRDGLALVRDVCHAADDPAVRGPGAIPAHKAPADTKPANQIHQWATCDRCHRDYLTATGCDCTQPRTHGCPDDLRGVFRLPPRTETQ